MTPRGVIEALRKVDRFPAEAIDAAARHREVLTDLFIDEFESWTDGRKEVPGVWDDLPVMALHLLAEWRVGRAFAPVLDLLRSDAYELIDEPATETVGRAVAQLFDGDVGPLHDAIADSQADGFVRSDLIEALAILTHRGLVPRDSTEAFLRSIFPELLKETSSLAWIGWLNAVCALGYEELVPLVKELFERDVFDTSIMDYGHFERDYDRARVEGGFPAIINDAEITSARDELAGWTYGENGSGAAAEDDDMELDNLRLDRPAVNEFRDVGRNDPCPCGSGKKYKKCCLDKAA